MIIYLANPTIGVRGMLTHIVAALGHTPAFHKSTLAPQAAQALAAEHAERGRNPVLVVDEAHLLDNHQLEAIRLLTNHDMDAGSPFAVLLVGQPTLRQRLRLGVLAALDQRIAVRYHIGGMSAADTADYIRHPCKIAGRSDTLFSDDAIALIHNASEVTRAPSTTSPCRRSPPPSPPTTPSSTRKQPASPSPKPLRTEPDPRRLDHHPVNQPTTPSPRPPRPRSPHPAGPISCPNPRQPR